MTRSGVCSFATIQYRRGKSISGTESPWRGDLRSVIDRRRKNDYANSHHDDEEQACIEFVYFGRPPQSSDDDRQGDDGSYGPPLEALEGR